MNARALLSLASLACTLTAPLSAQPIRPEDIADQAIGWIKVYNFTDAVEPMKVDTRVFSPAQLNIGRNFANWMQASYVPTGGLGDVTRSVSERLTQYNQITAAWPQSYGAYVSVYTDLRYGANKVIERASASRLYWLMTANGYFGEALSTLSTPEHYYFILPTFAQQGYGDELEKAADVSSHPVLGQFPTWFQRNSASGNRRYVLLSKDHRLPFVKLTRGEYFDALAAAIARWYAAEKVRVAEAEQGNARAIAQTMTSIDARHAKRLAILADNRSRYKSRLQETAEVSSTEAGISIENDADVFIGNGGSSLRLPVYTVDPAVAERCKTDAPQWIVVAWTANLNDPVNKRLHDAILNNVNFQYVYDTFFDPEKVKGQKYAPLRSPSARTVVAAAPASDAARKNAADPSVHFFDDFSTSNIGQAPAGWRSTLDNSGKTSVITELPGLPGHWATISGFALTATGAPMPLPRDFTVTYDVVAARDYTWGARGVTFTLARKAGAPASSISVRVRPGFGGRDGEAAVEMTLPAGYAAPYANGAIPGFSNTAQNNRVTVTVRKQGELLQIFVDKTKIADFPKGVPESLQFDSMTFDLSGTARPIDQMYVSNIRITKA